MLELLRNALSRHIGQRLDLLYFIVITETCLSYARDSNHYDFRTIDDQLAQLEAWLAEYKADLANLDLDLLRQHLQIQILQECYEQAHIPTEVKTRPADYTPTATPTETLTNLRTHLAQTPANNPSDCTPTETLTKQRTTPAQPVNEGNYPHATSETTATTAINIEMATPVPRHSLSNRRTCRRFLPDTDVRTTTRSPRRCHCPRLLPW